MAQPAYATKVANRLVDEEDRAYVAKEVARLHKHVPHTDPQGEPSKNNPYTLKAHRLIAAHIVDYINELLEKGLSIDQAMEYIENDVLHTLRGPAFDFNARPSIEPTQPPQALN